MNQPLNEIHQSIQKLIGLHRQLLEVVRQEREALVSAELKAISEITTTKQSVIEAIRQCEAQRLKHSTELAVLWKKPLRELTLPNIIVAVQGTDQRFAEQLRSSLNALTVLIQRVTEQNEDNRVFVERSLEHVHQMKKNVLGEAAPKSNTYNPQGQRAGGKQESRLISKEI